MPNDTELEISGFEKFAEKSKTYGENEILTKSNERRERQSTGTATCIFNEMHWPKIDSRFAVHSFCLSRLLHYGADIQNYSPNVKKWKTSS